MKLEKGSRWQSNNNGKVWVVDKIMWPAHPRNFSGETFVHYHVEGHESHPLDWIGVSSLRREHTQIS